MLVVEEEDRLGKQDVDLGGNVIVISNWEKRGGSFSF